MVVHWTMRRYALSTSEKVKGEFCIFVRSTKGKENKRFADWSAKYHEKWSFLQHLSVRLFVCVLFSVFVLFQFSKTAKVDARIELFGFPIPVPGIESNLCKSSIRCPVLKVSRLLLSFTITEIHICVPCMYISRSRWKFYNRVTGKASRRRVHAQNRTIAHCKLIYMYIYIFIMEFMIALKKQHSNKSWDVCDSNWRTTRQNQTFKWWPLIFFSFFPVKFDGPSSNLRRSSSSCFVFPFSDRSCVKNTKKINMVHFS